ncbi:hypothetical protein ACMHYB_19820 [Sorangium sp. So ce1128]
MQGLVLEVGDHCQLDQRLARDPLAPGPSISASQPRTRSARPLTDATNLVDRDGAPGATYTVRPVLDGGEQAESKAVPVWRDGYLSIETPAPPAGDGYSYSTGDGSVRDVDGDG